MISSCSQVENSLIEQLGRDLNQKRSEIVSALRKHGIGAILKNADILHCEPIEKVADDAMTEFRLNHGSYDNISRAKFAVPDVWTMGKVYARLIEDVSDEDNVQQVLFDVYGSWIDERLSDYNSAFYYQPRDYIAECYREGMVIDG